MAQALRLADVNIRDALRSDKETPYATLAWPYDNLDTCGQSAADSLCQACTGKSMTLLGVTRAMEGYTSLLKESMHYGQLVWGLPAHEL